jgi:putative phosphoribosyl transferase
MSQSYPPYRDRTHAGQVLAALLKNVLGNRKDLLVLALPRGGVPVAYEVAVALSLPLDLLLVRKLGLPGQEELAMGAMASGGIRVMNENVVGPLGVPPALIERVARREEVELERRQREYRGNRPLPQVEGRRVIAVDDGLATGASMRVAVAALRQQKPARIVVAVPVAPPDTVRLLAHEADEVICPATPEPFFGVGQWYDNFDQTTDEEIRRLLDLAWGQGVGHVRENNAT